ncbi:hypothetical protein FB446DRAFT_739006 [Lentinula raphanica]|nr:hypothetical protein FB446DRAFT_739006 [Lentinula raphanica]
MAKLIKKPNWDPTCISSSKAHDRNDNRSRTVSLTTRTVSTSSIQSYSGKRVSKTMQMALLSESASGSPAASLAHISTSINTSPSIPYPRSTSEQYWAARALTAETLLVARKEHSEHLKNITATQETKRSNEVTRLTKMYDARLVKLERLLVILLSLLCLFAFFTFVSNFSLVRGAQRSHGARSQWAHFTIPILSPFASVVENEVSVIGSKTIFGFCLIMAGLAYFLLRFWISSRKYQHAP